MAMPFDDSTVSCANKSFRLTQQQGGKVIGVVFHLKMAFSSSSQSLTSNKDMIAFFPLHYLQLSGKFKRSRTC